MKAKLLLQTFITMICYIILPSVIYGQAAGPNTAIQYNNSGVFAGNPDFTFEYSGSPAAFTVGSAVYGPGRAFVVDFDPANVLGNVILIGDVDYTFNGSLLEVNDNTETLSWNMPTTIINGVTYNWPNVQGATGTVLTNNGSGTLTWTPSGGGGGCTCPAAWQLLGNAGTTYGTNFIGTTDDNNLMLQVNSQIAGRIEDGTSTGTTMSTSLGYQALNVNTGIYNVALGYQALYSNTSAGGNTAIGSNALYSNVDGSLNVAIGYNALSSTVGTVFFGGSSNTAVGGYTLTNNVDGYANVAVGFRSMSDNDDGYQNTACGDGSLYNNVDGINNSAFGQSALSSTTSSNNDAFGSQALYSNITGSPNDAFGYESLYSNTYTSQNIGIGYQALYTQSYTNGNTPYATDNIAIGYHALYFNNPTSTTNGIYNTSIGDYSLYTNSTGNNNTAVGYQSLYSNSTGIYDVAIGAGALYNNTGATNTNICLSTPPYGDENVAVGYWAAYSGVTLADCTYVGTYCGQTSSNGINNVGLGCWADWSDVNGFNNSIIGEEAGYSNLGSDNTFVGYQAGFTNYGSSSDCDALEGSGNAFFGSMAGWSNDNGNDNTCIGYFANLNGGNYTDAAAIGSNATNTEGSNTMVFSDANSTGLYINTYLFETSDGRFKQNIAPNVIGLAFINKLKPVTYNWNVESLDEHIHGGNVKHNQSDLDAMVAKDKIVYSGFIAQDVEAAAKSVGYNFNGVHTPQNDNDPYALSYTELVVPIVKAVQELSEKNNSKDSIITQQQQQLSSESQQISSQQQQLTSQQSELDQLSAMISKLDLALSQCCTNYQSTTGTGTSLQNGSTTNSNDVPLLNQNIPNPFTQNTIISCYVPTSSHNASIVVFNLDGQKLNSFTIGNTGFNQIIITGGTLPAGDYLYTLFVDGQKIDTKKMTLTR